MSVPTDLDTGRGPPTAVPLRHFVVGLAFLVAGSGVAALDAVGAAPALAELAALHLLLVGWVCVTILGAMTQFVPVWSGVRLHSRRLAVAQLWLVAAGVAGLAAALLAGRLALLAVAGLPLVAGFWTFAYNLARTLPRERDVTETHFALALGFLVVATGLGYLLAVDLAWPVLPIARPAVVGAHATLAVFGVVLTTVVGALYQLSTMFTGAGLRGVDHHVRRTETVAYPAGVVALAGGRLVANAALARAGGVLVALSLFGVSVVLARLLRRATVERTPMLSRYAVAALALPVWAALALAAWLRDPLSAATRLGAPGTRALLVFGAVGCVVVGTLYHVVPFLVWVRRYADRLGIEAVPMVDDLYSDRLAAVDFALFVGGTAVLVAADLLALPLATAGATLVGAGAVAVLWNVALVVRRHSSHSLPVLLFGGEGA